MRLKAAGLLQNLLGARRHVYGECAAKIETKYLHSFLRDLEDFLLRTRESVLGIVFCYLDRT